MIRVSIERRCEAAMNRREFGFGLGGDYARGVMLKRSARFAQRFRHRCASMGRVSTQHLQRPRRVRKEPAGRRDASRLQRSGRQGREYVMGLMRAAKLDVSIDAAGNIIGRRHAAGGETKAPPLVLGSHIDSVPDGGNYDGDVGSLGAIEVAQTLAENNIRLEAIRSK